MYVVFGRVFKRFGTLVEVFINQDGSLHEIL